MIYIYKGREREVWKIIGDGGELEEEGVELKIGDNGREGLVRGPVQANAGHL